MVYNLLGAEIRFLRLFCNTVQMFGFEDLTDLEKSGDLSEILEGLMQKGYLNRDDEDRLFLTGNLTFLFQIAGQADAAFAIRGEERSLFAYFKGDAIALLTTGQTYQMMWLPAIYLLIGAVADFLEPFSGFAGGERKTYEPEALSGIIEELTKSGYRKKWEIVSFDGSRENSDPAFEVYEKDQKQVLIQRDEAQIIACEPNKEDYVNALTRKITRLYAESIKKGEKL